ncbi:HEAT repeat domain-containing protein [Saccharothrix stipae]
MWDQLEHAYGLATDVPDLLAQVRDPVAAPAAIGELNANVYHNGEAVYSAAPALLPALLDLAEDPTITVRTAVVDTVGDLAHTARTAEPHAVHEAWPPAWAAAVPRLLRLLGDSDVEVRRMVTFPLAQARGHDVWPHLRDRFAVEPDLPARLGLVVATAHHADPAARSWLTGLLPDPTVRLAAAAGLWRLGIATDARSLLDGFADVSGWADTWCVGSPRPSAVVWWLNRELGDDRATRRTLVAGLLDHPDPDIRAGALWSSPPLLDADLLPLIADRLPDEEPENRRLAASLLASTQTPPAGTPTDPTPPAVTYDLGPFADDLALAARDVYLPAADAALTALALLGDVRAVEPLRQRLSGPRLGLTAQPRTRPWSPPPLDEVLTAMRDHADALLPAVRARLDTTSDQLERAAFHRILNSWQASTQHPHPH